MCFMKHYHLTIQSLSYWRRLWESRPASTSIHLGTMPDFVLCTIHSCWQFPCEKNGTNVVRLPLTLPQKWELHHLEIQEWWKTGSRSSVKSFCEAQLTSVPWKEFSSASRSRSMFASTLPSLAQKCYANICITQCCRCLWKKTMGLKKIVRVMWIQ
jgi:hypothetical protein